ncbi:MAG: tyrosine-type recombinase/integrase [Thermaerobacter sp.]|nr:tyrosine-type recombinase/integrase [Thermaerobacter sp.]
MNALPFEELTSRLETELHRLHYKEPSIKGYQRMWLRIASFLANQGTSYLTEELGMAFLEREFNYFELERTGKVTQSICNAFRVVRMLLDFQQHGSVLRRYYKQRDLLNAEGLKLVLRQFAEYCRLKGYSRVTQKHYSNICEKFLSFVESQQIMHVAAIEPRHVSAFINTLLGYMHKTVELHLCGLRAFLRYLHTSGLHTQDLSGSIPSVMTRKQARMPSVWNTEQVTKLLEAIDRGNPAGKRDYAIILLVARLGLRTIDIKRLQLTNLNWRENRIELVQSKTARPLKLPLLPEVGWAIIDYLKNGRPKVDSPYVFLRHLAPIEPFSEEDRLHQMVVKYMKLARIPISPQKKKGLHSLRHTLASRLLRENTPLSVISDILGHISTDSTAVYLKVDVDMLRECALNPEAVLVNE